MSRSIRWRIAIPYAVLIALGTLGLSLYLSRQMRQIRLADLENQIPVTPDTPFHLASVTKTSAAVVMMRLVQDGKLLWTYGIEKTTAVIPTPIVRGDLVFFTAGYNRGGALLRQIPNGDGEVKVEAVYPLNTELNNKHGGVILVGDYLYGDTNDQGTPFCAEFMTGKVVWKERGRGRNSAAITAADGHLSIRWADGTLALAKASPEGLPRGTNRQSSACRVPNVR